MTLKEQLNQDLKDAMRGGDVRRRDTLRMIIAAIRNAEIGSTTEEDGAVATAPSPDVAPGSARHELSDDDVEALLRRQVKQRRDSIDAFRKGGREDLAAIETAEIEVLSVYLPQQLDRVAVEAEARSVITETGAAGPRDKNKVMPVLMQRLAGRAEGRLINDVVTDLLGRSP